MNGLKFFDGEKCEVVLKPTDAQIDQMVTLAHNLMRDKMERWVLDRLTVEQLENCVHQFKAEIKRREDEAAK